MYYLILLVFFLSFVGFIYFSFQVHFCSIFPHLFTFFAFFFSFVFQMSPSFASFVCYYFQFYPYWPFVNPSRRPSRPSKLSGKPKSLLTLLLCYFGLQLVNLLYFYPPSHSNLCTGNHQPQNQPRSQGPLLLIYQEDSENDVARSFSTFCDTHISSQVSIRFTCWRRSLNWLHHQHHYCLLPLTLSLLWRHHRHQATKLIQQVVMSPTIPVLLVTVPYQTVPSYL